MNELNYTYFNSRPSARGDTPSGSNTRAISISIHAPPRGATRGASSFPPACAYFNSRPSARGDTLDCDAAKLLLLFQFTPLREGRRNESTQYP